MSTEDAEVVDERKPVRTRSVNVPARRQAHVELEPYGLIQSAVDQGAGVETLKELVSLKERVDNEEARRAWHQAVSKFQSECPPLPKTKKGRFGKYAPLGNSMKIVSEHLSNNGLSVTWATRRYETEPFPYMVCKLAHSMGHVEESECAMVVDEDAGRSSDGKDTLNAMQKVGIAHSYARRYSFEAVIGLAPSDEHGDTDGDATSGQAVTRPQRKATAPEKTTAPPAAKQAAEKEPRAEKGGDVERGRDDITPVEVSRHQGSTNGKPWLRFDAMCSDGNKMSTFSEGFGVIFEAAAQTGETLDVVWHQGRYGRLCDEIIPAGEEGPE